MKRVTSAAGFTLTELTVAIAIIALLLGGALIPLSAQVEVRRIADTQRTMEQIREALIGYAQSYGRLPCPALATIASGAAGAGTEQYSTGTTACTAMFGVIPWATLGVPETDAWGRRFTYRVARVFSGYSAPRSNTTNPPDSGTQNSTNSLDCASPSPPPNQSAFALCSLGDSAVLTRDINPTTGIHTTSALGTGLAAVFLSHGKNGYGGYQSNGIQISGVTASTDEAYNAAGGDGPSNPGSVLPYSSYLFYYRPPTPSTTGCSETAAATPFCEFDDLVFMIPATTLVARMVSAGRLP